MRTKKLPANSLPPEGAEFFAAYSQHSSVLRTWLVAYGIGAPALFLSQEFLWVTLSKSGQLPRIAALFLSGVVLQVLLAAINKSVMWACYYGIAVPTYKSSKRYKFASWLSERYLIDFACDLVSMTAFGIATYWCFALLGA